MLKNYFVLLQIGLADTESFGWINGADYAEMLQRSGFTIFNPNHLFQSLLSAAHAEISIIINAFDLEAGVHIVLRCGVD